MGKINGFVVRLKMDSIALWFATKHPETLFVIKIVIWFVVAYTLSPIDLIPDFIPFFGILDDLILMALTVTFAVHLISKKVITRCRALAIKWFEKQKKHPTIFYGAFLVIALWIIVLIVVYKFYFKNFNFL